MAFFQRANLRIEKKSEESAVLLLDVAGRSVNVFNREVFADLEAARENLAQRHRRAKAEVVVRNRPGKQ